MSKPRPFFLWPGKKPATDFESARLAERDRRARMRLIAGAGRDDRAAFKRKLWRNIALGWLLWYIYHFGNFYFHYSWDYIVWALIVLPLVVTLTYVMTALVVHDQQAREQKYKAERARRPELPGRRLSPDEQAAKIRQLREGFRAARSFED